MMQNSSGGAAPLVSVVTPCYNAEPFVGETIRSVLAQSYAPVELVVVDDASSDGSREVVRGYAEAHPERVRPVFLERNGGGSHARNRGAEVARGEFLMFLDADDVIAPDTLAALVEAVRDRPGCIAICGWRRLRQVDGVWTEAPAEVPLPAPGADPLRGWLEGVWVPPCAVLWRRDVYERTGGWDEQLTSLDDADLMMGALAEGARLMLAEGGQSYYRLHEDEDRISLSRNVFSEAKLRSRVRVLEKLAAKLEKSGSLAAYAAPIGAGYHELAALGFLQKQTDFARECLRRAEHYAGPRAASAVALGRTLPGRLLSRLLGVERKEKVVAGLARLGIATPERRRFTEFCKLHAAGGDGSAGGRGHG